MCFLGPVRLYCQLCDRDIGRHAIGRTYCDTVMEARMEDCPGVEWSDQEQTSSRGHNCISCQEELVARECRQERISQREIRQQLREERRVQRESERREHQRELEDISRERRTT